MDSRDLRGAATFQPCSSAVICGPTGSGKSRWVYRFLTNLDRMYDSDTPKDVMYCYGVYQPLFDEIRTNLPSVRLHRRLPTSDVLDDFATGDHCLVILDDLMLQVLESREVELLFAQGCHHRRISVFYISQNLYGQGKSARTIALNSWYLVLLKNLRGSSQMAHLGRQLFCKKGNPLLEAYQDSTKEPFGYIVVDLSPNAKDEERLRTKIFPGDDTVVYIPKNP